MILTARHIAPLARETLADTRIVNVVGAPGSGKTTLLRDMLETFAYVDLEDEAVRRSVAEDPYGMLKGLTLQAKASGLPVAIDGFHCLPSLVLALKRIVDEDGRPGQFVLAAPYDVFRHPKSADSLAGRVSTLKLRPLSVAEIRGAGPCRLLDAVEERPQNVAAALPRVSGCTREETIGLVLGGGYPGALNEPEGRRASIFAEYAGKLAVRDVPMAHPVRNTDAARRLLDLVAFDTARELNAGRMAKKLGVRHETLENHLDALVRLQAVVSLPAWNSVDGNREIRSPKLHLTDTGLAAALRGESSGSFGIGSDPAAIGSLFETFVFNELEKSLPFQSSRWSLGHWRADRRKVDIVAEGPGRTFALFRTRATSRIGPEDFQDMDWFLSEGPGKDGCGTAVVLYIGEHALSFGPGKVALPVSTLWSYPLGYEV